MILTEDRAFSEFSLTEGDIAVPVEILHCEGMAEPEITVYEPFLPIAEEFARIFGQDPFSDAAILFLKEKLTEPMRDYGFTLSKSIDHRIRLFLMTSTDEVNGAVIRQETEIISGADDLSGLRNLTTHRLEMDPEDPDDISAIVLDGDAIVAYATENDAIFGETQIEISVECAPAYRGQGLAASCAAALADALLRRGYDVSYKCRHTNAASARVAEKAGFRENGMQYSFVCYRDEE